jgi:hypothetical protein
MDTLNPWFTIGLVLFAVYVALAMLGSRDRGDSAASKRSQRGLRRTHKRNS